MDRISAGSGQDRQPLRSDPRWKAFEIALAPRAVRLIGELNAEHPESVVDPRPNTVARVKETLFSQSGGNADALTDEEIKGAFKKKLVKRGSLSDAFDA